MISEHQFIALTYYLCVIYWIAAIGIYSLRFINRKIHKLLQYGRFSSEIASLEDPKEQNQLLEILNRVLMTPFISEKVHWCSIYTVGFLLNSMSLCEILCHHSASLPNTIAIILYEIHLLKRCIEVFLLQPWVFPPRQVGFLLYGSGISYYVFSTTSFWTSARSTDYSDTNIPRTIIGLFCFLYFW